MDWPQQALVSSAKIHHKSYVKRGRGRTSDQGRVVQSPIKLTQDLREFQFQVYNFSLRFSVYIVWPSVLSLGNLNLYEI